MNRHDIPIFVVFAILAAAAVYFGFFYSFRPLPRALSTATVSPVPAADGSGCRVSGCSGQICSDEPVVTTCEFQQVYACYRFARCERQINGACGWTWTPSLAACVRSFSK